MSEIPLAGAVVAFQATFTEMSSASTVSGFMAYRHGWQFASTMLLKSLKRLSGHQERSHPLGVGSLPDLGGVLFLKSTELL